MPTIDELIAGIGMTDAKDRAAIAHGTALLPTLDALIANTEVALPRRMAATRVANEIRVRALDAPAAVAPAAVAPVAPEGTEARAYFAAGGQLGDGFHARHQPNELVDVLHAAGAVRVHVVRDCLIATLPEDPEARARLFAIYNAEVDVLGEEFGGEELDGHEMTDAEANAIGQPEAVGEWVVDGLHARDRGLATLTLWWD
ncbi:MAG: hypothetical protein ABJE66_30060 [Deltaproteobacteria bacterium]